GLVHLGRAGDGTTVGGEAARGDIAFLRLYREPLCVIVAPGHRLAGRAGVRLADLAREDLLAFRPGSTVRQPVPAPPAPRAPLAPGPRRRQPVAAAPAGRGPAPRTPSSPATRGPVRAVGAAGRGVAFAPASAAVAAPALRALPLSAPRLERIVALVRSKARY